MIAVTLWGPHVIRCAVLQTLYYVVPEFQRVLTENVCCCFLRK